jgi:myo-inositol 2-dehydrogenase / D-chiro-inositol 1-dehydrogenase
MAYKVGVIGTGAIGVEHARRINQRIGGASVVALTDIDGARAKEIAAGIGARALPTGRDVIAAPDVDVVVVTSWGPTHEEFVVASIAAGKPVFCEKPLATTAAGCLRIVEAEVKQGKRLVQVGFMRRYDAGYRALREIVAGGKIGDPLMVHCAHRNPTVGNSYTTDMAITDTVIHEIDVLRWLLDDDYVAVQVVYPRKTRNAFNHLHDPQLVMMETAKGVRIDVEVFVNCKYGYDIQCEVVGETGVARLPEPASVSLRSEARRSVEILVDWKQRFFDAYDVELQAFFDDLGRGGPTGPSSWDGYAAAVTADACVQAQQSGKVVPVSTRQRPAFYGSPR